MTVAEYLRRIRPVYKNNEIGHQLAALPGSRWRTFEAVREVLLAGDASADYHRAVAATNVAATRHGTEFKAVWRLVRRYRDLIQKRPEEQLTLPF
jgi:hypothetical protein